MYSYDRTAAQDDTKQAIAWMYKRRMAVIRKSFKAMKDELEKIQDEALQMFPNLDLPDVHRALQLKEAPFRRTLL